MFTAAAAGQAPADPARRDARDVLVATRVGGGGPRCERLVVRLDERAEGKLAFTSRDREYADSHKLLAYRFAGGRLSLTVSDAESLFDGVVGKLAGPVAALLSDERDEEVDALSRAVAANREAYAAAKLEKRMAVVGELAVEYDTLRERLDAIKATPMAERNVVYALPIEQEVRTYELRRNEEAFVEGVLLLWTREPAAAIRTRTLYAEFESTSAERDEPAEPVHVMAPISYETARDGRVRAAADDSEQPSVPGVRHLSVEFTRTTDAVRSD